MRKYKIPRILFIFTLSVVLLLFGTVLAYMFKQTKYVNNVFTPAEVSCEIQEITDTPLTEKKSIKVQNTGTVESYIRVRFVSYWVDYEGNIVSKPSTMPKIEIEKGWITGKNNTYYFQNSVSSNNFTDELLSSPIVLNEDDNGYLQVVEVFAEAIQSKPDTAVTNSWNVMLDSEGNIIYVP